MSVLIGYDKNYGAKEGCGPLKKDQIGMVTSLGIAVKEHFEKISLNIRKV